MPVSASDLLKDLQKWVTRFEDDLRERCSEDPALEARLRAQYDAAKEGKRTGHPYKTWLDETLTQSAVAWVLACVFVRFLEDNELLESPFLSGPGELRDIAGENRLAYFRENRTHSDVDYLLHVFTELARLPGMADLFDRRHNELWNASISGDAANAFLEFWRRIDPDTGQLAHDFTDPGKGGGGKGVADPTRFLGDLYQSLSESARKRFALLQTPEFVEEFILDRTLGPALDTFGYANVRMIDPTCGSGHFLLGGFARLLPLWQADHPEMSEREIAAKALAAIHGVDINPFAVAIARFRLLMAAWRFCGVNKLRSAPAFEVRIATGDSLIHGRRFRVLRRGQDSHCSIEISFPSGDLFVAFLACLTSRGRLAGWPDFRWPAIHRLFIVVVVLRRKAIAIFSLLAFGNVLKSVGLSRSLASQASSFFRAARSRDSPTSSPPEDDAALLPLHHPIELVEQC